MRISIPLAAIPLVAAALSGCLGGQSGGDAAADPVAKITVEPLPSGPGFRADGTQSTDPSGDALAYQWSWPSGSSTEPSFDLLLDPAVDDATVMLSLIVTAPDGRAGVDMVPLTIGSGANKEPMAMIQPEANRWVQPGSRVTLDGAASHDLDDDPVAYEWIWGPRSDFDPDLVQQMASMDMFVPNLDHRTFSTGTLNGSASFDAVFDKPGTYNLLCHPHPWMKGRLVVTDDQPATDGIRLPIQNFRFGNGTTTVGTGSRVIFENQDPVVHTASLNDYTPGTESGGTNATFSAELPEGEYVARLIVTDPNGGRATSSWGLKSSPDAPTDPFPINHASAGNEILVAGTSGASTQTPSFEQMHAGLVNVTLTWPNPTSTSTATVVFLQGPPDRSQDVPVEGCAAIVAPADDPGRATIACPIVHQMTDSYWFKVEATAGVVSSWSLDGTIQLYAVPGFGDTTGVTHQH